MAERRSDPEGERDPAVELFDDEVLDAAMSELGRWAAEGRVADAVHERRHRGWLEEQSRLDADFLAALVGLAERGRPVVVRLANGRRHRGIPTVVGRDVVELHLEGGGRVLVASGAIASVRSADEVVVTGPPPETAATLAGRLAGLVEDRPRVLVVGTSAAEQVTGQLDAVGRDVVIVRTDGGGLAYVPLDSVAEVSVPESG